MTTLGQQAIGTIVRFRENNVLTNYVVANQGSPSAAYQGFENMTTLVREEVLANRVWNNPNNNDYQNSQIHAWLNDGFLATIEADIRNLIPQVRVPFRPGSGTSQTVNSGANGLLCRIFLLSHSEVGFTNNPWGTAHPTIGARLAHFLAGDSGDASTRRIAHRAGAAAHWWLRTPSVGSADRAWFVDTNGHASSDSASSTSRGSRPALPLPSSLSVSSDGSLVSNQPPTPPESITVPEQLRRNVQHTVSWGVATDPDGTVNGYILDRSINGGTWTEIYRGARLYAHDTPQASWDTVQYRARAFDNNNAEGDNVTSPVRTVMHLNPPAISGVDEDIGLQEISISKSYSVTNPDHDIDPGRTLTITEKVNKTEKRTFAAQFDTDYSFEVTANEFVEILNGNDHCLTVIALDSHGMSDTRRWTFSKSENEIELTLTTPLQTQEAATRAVMNVVRNLPPGADFTVEVCNNGFDSSPAWEDVTSSVTIGSRFFLQNTTLTALHWGFNFRVKVSRNNALGDIYVAGVGGNFE